MSTTLYAARLSDNSEWWAKDRSELATFASGRGTPASLGIITFNYEGPVVAEWEEGGDDIFDEAQDALYRAFGMNPDHEE